MYLYNAYADMRKGGMGVRKYKVLKDTPTRYYVTDKQMYRKDELDKLVVSGNDISILTTEEGLEAALISVKKVLMERLTTLQDMINRCKSDGDTLEKIKGMTVSEPVSYEPIEITEDMLD